MGKFQKGNKIGNRFSADNQPDGRGRKPKLRAIPADARDKVYAALYHALTLPDQKTAADYLNKVADELPECGYLIQVYAKGMMSKNAGIYTSDILDRLFGKPKQVSEIGFTKEVPVIVTASEKDALAKWAKSDEESK